MIDLDPKDPARIKEIAELALEQLVELLAAAESMLEGGQAAEYNLRQVVAKLKANLGLPERGVK